MTPPRPVQRLLRRFALLVLAAAALPACHAKTPNYHSVTIHNDIPRRDTAGHILDAHDGNLQFFNGRYYLYGTAYDSTAGFSINNRFRVYSSADLEHWTYEGEILKSPPDGVYYRPYVAYNPTTRKYVLWYNWYPKLWNGQVGVAVSDTPIGPFTIVNSDVQLSQAADHPGDGSLFVDHDNTAYFIYTTIDQRHSIRIEKLRPDFLSSTGQVSPVLAQGCEAPALFRRGDTYYALFDSTCCFCKNGSGARVYTASAPLGPYTLRGNINRDPDHHPVIHAQQTYVATIPSPGGPTMLWMADRWGSRPDHIKGHDFQYWAPLHFTPDGAIDDLTDTPVWSATIQIGARPPTPRHPYTWPKKSDPNPLTVDPCNQAPLTPVESGAVLSETP